MSVKPKAVLMNDTSTRYHHGCARVMRLLVDGLERHGLEIIARSPARHDWEKDARFLEAVRQADVIVTSTAASFGAQVLRSFSTNSSISSASVPPV